MQILETLLQRAFPGCQLVESVQLSGGVSAQATVCRVVLPGGATERVVVRRPGSAYGSNDVQEAALEFRVLGVARALGIVVPAPRYFDEASGALVLEYLPGQPDFAPLDRAASMRSMAEALAAIHRVTSDVADLSFLPRREHGAAQSIERDPESFDEELDEARVRAVLRTVWPWPQRNPSALLHGDFWPGNLLWRAGAISGVIDWEESSYGDPLADVALARLDLWWAFGSGAMDEFTRHYQSLTHLDWTSLPHWDLCIALRPMSNLSRWARAYPAPPISRPDIDAASMRHGHRCFVANAFARLGS